MKLSDYGQKMRMVTGFAFEAALVSHDQLRAHWHVADLRRIYAQVTQCPRCGFWLPIGALAACPQCEAHR